MKKLPSKLRSIILYAGSVDDPCILLLLPFHFLFGNLSVMNKMDRCIIYSEYKMHIELVGYSAWLVYELNDIRCLMDAATNQNVSSLVRLLIFTPPLSFPTHD